MATLTLENVNVSDEDIALMISQIENYANSKELLTQNTIDSILRGIEEIDPYNESDIIDFAKGAAQVVNFAQVNAGIMTEAYLRNILTIQGVLPPIRSLVEIGEGLREGIQMYQAYMRPFNEYRYYMSKYDDFDRALAAQRQRAESLVDTDLSMATRKASKDTLESTKKITGYRRIVHPELSRGGSCGLCVIAADRVYKKTELMPIHDKCKCTVLPVTNKSDPGLQLNADQIAAFYDAAGSTEGSALKRVQAKVSMHGEIGPVLRDANNSFRGPSAIAA